MGFKISKNTYVGRAPNQQKHFTYIRLEISKTLTKL